MIEGFTPERRAVDTFVTDRAGAVCGTEIGLLEVARLGEDDAAVTDAEIIRVTAVPVGTRLISAVTAPALTATPTASMNIWSFISGSMLRPYEIFLKLYWAFSESI